MSAVSALWRYPIKSHGSEGLSEVTLTAGKTLPWDRVWAVAHEASTAPADEWAPCANFTRVAKAPALAALRAVLHEADETVTLSHPELGQLRFSPDTEAEAFLNWTAPLVPTNRAKSARLVRPSGRGMTDTPEPTVSLNSVSSHRAVSQKLGRDLSPLRWRGNIWLDGLGPWQEFEWIGRQVQIGDAVLEVIGRIDRCTATTANPDTGQRDADTLGALEDGWGHVDFGVHAVVRDGGHIRLGDPVKVLT